MERLVLMTAGHQIKDTDLPDNLHVSSRTIAGEEESLEGARKAFEREFLSAKLQENGWNISRTAEAIGIARESLSRKIKAFKIEIQRD